MNGQFPAGDKSRTSFFRIVFCARQGNCLYPPNVEDRMAEHTCRTTQEQQMNWKSGLLLAIVFVTFAGVTETAEAQTNGYYPYVIARGQDRQRIRSMPIELRPNRPLHFYGNAVRRRYYGRPVFQAPVRRIFQPAVPQFRSTRIGQGIRLRPLSWR